MADVSDEGLYVYGLIDPAVRRRTKDDLLSVFYVGKGKNSGGVTMSRTSCGTCAANCTS